MANLASAAEDSVKGISFDGVSNELHSSVSFTLLLLDTIIDLFPHPKYLNISRELPMKQIKTIHSITGELPADNPIVWVASYGEDHTLPRFPPETDEDVKKMVLYSTFCDHVTMIAEEILEKLIGNSWSISRMTVMPPRQHMLIKHYEGSDPDYTDALRGKHTIIGVFSLEDTLENGLTSIPYYAFDPAILQYREPNERRFSVWKRYQDFTMRFGNVYFAPKLPFEDEGTRAAMYNSPFWSIALQQIHTWNEQGKLNIKTINNPELRHNLVGEMMERLSVG